VVRFAIITSRCCLRFARSSSTVSGARATARGFPSSSARRLAPLPAPAVAGRCASCPRPIQIPPRQAAQFALPSLGQPLAERDLGRVHVRARVHRAQQRRQFRLSLLACAPEGVPLLATARLPRLRMRLVTEIENDRPGTAIACFRLPLIRSTRSPRAARVSAVAPPSSACSCDRNSRVFRHSPLRVRTTSPRRRAPP
jgi:hypothetical protein